MKEGLKKTIINSLLVNIFIVVMAFVVFKGVSYSINSDGTDNKDLIVKTGNMQVVLSVPSEHYSFLDNMKIGVSDSIGVNQDGYTFTLNNTGNIPIEYYEIRLVNEENKISTLPHNYIRFTINKDNNNYSEIKNLGDMDSVIYAGENLDVGKSATFNFKMWIDEKAQNTNNMTLFSALEVTLYQKREILNNYILYESDGGRIPYKTPIYHPISEMIPEKEGYHFLGWSTSFNGEVKYHSGDTYKEKKGVTLYAIWEKVKND